MSAPASLASAFSAAAFLIAETGQKLEEALARTPQDAEMALFLRRHAGIALNRLERLLELLSPSFTDVDDEARLCQALAAILAAGSALHQEDRPAAPQAL